MNRRGTSFFLLCVAAALLCSATTTNAQVPPACTAGGSISQGGFIYTLTFPVANFRTALTPGGCPAGSVLAGYILASDVSAVNFLAFNCAAGVWVNEPTMGGLCPRVAPGASTTTLSNCELLLPFVCRAPSAIVVPPSSNCTASAPVTQGGFVYTLTLPPVDFRVAITTACPTGSVPSGFTSAADVAALRLLAVNCTTGIWVYEATVGGMCPLVLDGATVTTLVNCQLLRPVICKAPTSIVIPPANCTNGATVSQGGFVYTLNLAPPVNFRAALTTACPAGSALAGFSNPDDIIAVNRLGANCSSPIWVWIAENTVGGMCPSVLTPTSTTSLLNCELLLPYVCRAPVAIPVVPDNCTGSATTVQGGITYTRILPAVNFRGAITTACPAGTVPAGFTSPSDIAAVNFLAANCSGGVWVNQATVGGLCPHVQGGVLSLVFCELLLPVICRGPVVITPPVTSNCTGATTTTQSGFVYTLTLPPVDFRVAITTACPVGSVPAGYTTAPDIAGVNFLAANCTGGVWVFEDTLGGQCPRVAGGMLTRINCQTLLPVICVRPISRKLA